MNCPGHLWAPWRSDYVSSTRKEEECVFCRVAREKKDKENGLLARGKKSFAVLNIYPYNCGHSLVAPYRHTGEYESLSGAELSEMNLLVKELMKKMKEKMSAQGFNLGINLGSAAGAGIAGHIHIHIVPRWSGDTNFMPVVGGDKVMPQSLETVWRKLRVKI